MRGVRVLSWGDTLAARHCGQPIVVAQQPRRLNGCGHRASPSGLSWGALGQIRNMGPAAWPSDWRVCWLQGCSGETLFFSTRTSTSSTNCTLPTRSMWSFTSAYSYTMSGKSTGKVLPHLLPPFLAPQAAPAKSCAMMRDPVICNLASSSTLEINFFHIWFEILSGMHGLVNNWWFTMGVHYDCELTKLGMFRPKFPSNW